ncbi:TPA: hypothetical protein GRR52_25625 [Vibrio parahaemolyticus]|nr:hypothetical protein [Vibrio parahaemolyticus]
MNIYKNLRLHKITIFHLCSYFKNSYNAALRGEQRDATQLKLLCHKHKA